MPFVPSLIHPILDAQDALKYILDADTAFDNVDIRDGGPTEAEDIIGSAANDGAWSAFWFNDVTVPEDAWTSLGGQRRRITFLLGFTIATRIYGDDERAAKVQVLTIFEALMLLVKANPSLSGTVQMTSNVTGTLGQAPDSPSVWGGWFTGSLTVKSKAY